MEEKQTQTEQMFTKDAIIKSLKYKQYKDLLNAILQDKKYTLKQVDTLLNGYLKKGVK